MHGSITHRMEYLRNLSATRTDARFDRFMLRLYCTPLTLRPAVRIAAGALYVTFHVTRHDSGASAAVDAEDRRGRI